ncbi:MAG TPA: prepilin-type N-terminal cleavage/methylation domain-containing protein [Patescibacteria group bacterium]
MPYNKPSIVNRRSTIVEKKGFTLIELLVTIAIIGILSAIGLIAFTSAQQRSRDAKRKGDLKSIQSALEIYHSDFKKYPQSTSTSVETFTSSDGSTNWLTGLVNQYIKSLPQDPKNGTTYYYWYCVPATHLDYVMGVKIENANDPDINTAPTVTGCTAPAGTPDFNYFVQSP